MHSVTRQALLASLPLLILVGCATLGQVKKDPAATAREARDTALAACLACRLPDLPKPAQDACLELEPVCAALAGVCEEPAPAAVVAPPPGYGRKVL